MDRDPRIGRTIVASVEHLLALVGQEVGVSDWLMVDQDRIDRFADVTGDHQFIHVDRERAAQTPFGGTIAHGLLTLSLVPVLAVDALPRLDPVRMVINYGYDTIRFLSPVPSGSRIRARFRLLEFGEKQPGRWKQRSEVAVEIEGSSKPALHAQMISIAIV